MGTRQKTCQRGGLYWLTDRGQAHALEVIADRAVVPGAWGLHFVTSPLCWPMRISQRAARCLFCPLRRLACGQGGPAPRLTPPIGDAVCRAVMGHTECTFDTESEGRPELGHGMGLTGVRCWTG